MYLFICDGHSWKKKKEANESKLMTALRRAFRALSDLSSPHRYDPPALGTALVACRGERFALLVDRAPGKEGGGEPFVLLHREARGRDTAKALLALAHFRRLVRAHAAAAGSIARTAADAGAVSTETTGAADAQGVATSSAGLDDATALRLATEAQQAAAATYGDLIIRLQDAGWSTERFMLPVRKRAQWEIVNTTSSRQ